MKKFNLIFYSLFYLGYITIYFLPSLLLANSSNVKHWFNKAVLIKSYKQSYDWLNPWEKRNIKTKIGIGLVVDINNSKKIFLNKKIKNTLYLLTTAEISYDATLIEVTRKDVLQPFIAKIHIIDPAINLALLKIDNLEFWKKLEPVNWSKLDVLEKNISDNVQTLKIKSAEEWHYQSAKIEQMAVGYRRLLNAWFPHMKISGFSRGGQGYPIIKDNKTVGMMLEIKKGEAKVIPTEMILEFLKHSKIKKYKSLAHRGFNWKKLPQKSTAEYYKIPYQKSGILISRVLPYGTGSDVLLRGDYLTKIGQWQISYEGKINHPKWGVALFDLLFLDILKVGETIELNLIRNGEPINLMTEVSSFEDIGRLVPLEKIGDRPRYIINGGFLFQELSLNYLQMWGKNWDSRAPMRLRLFLENKRSLNTFLKSKKDTKNKSIKKNFNSRIVLVTKVIPDEINIGYQKISNAIVLKINNKEIDSLEDVDKAFLDPDGIFHRIDFLPGSHRLSAILPVKILNESNQRIQNNFSIPNLKSL